MKSEFRVFDHFAKCENETSYYDCNDGCMMIYRAGAEAGEYTDFQRVLSFCAPLLLHICSWSGLCRKTEKSGFECCQENEPQGNFHATCTGDEIIVQIEKVLRIVADPNREVYDCKSESADNPFMDFIEYGCDDFEIEKVYYNFPGLHIAGAEYWSEGDKEITGD